MSAQSWERFPACSLLSLLPANVCSTALGRRRFMSLGRCLVLPFPPPAPLFPWLEGEGGSRGLKRLFTGGAVGSWYRINKYSSFCRASWGITSFLTAPRTRHAIRMAANACPCQAFLSCNVLDRGPLLRSQCVPCIRQVFCRRGERTGLLLVVQVGNTVRDQTWSRRCFPSPAV